MDVEQSAAQRRVAVFSPVEKPRAFAYVVAEIERELVAGRIRVGDRLPGERQMAEQLGVSRATVREALRALELFGLVEARRGSGGGSGSHVVAGTDAGLRCAWRLHALATGAKASDLLHPLAVVQQHVATTLARERRGSVGEQLADANRAVAASDDWQQLLRADVELHVAAARLISDQLASGCAALASAAGDELLGARRGASVQAVAGRVAAEHCLLFDAIDRGDAAAGALAFAHALGDPLASKPLAVVA
ncbi:GntR family transcriptional regulator [Conexibacter sp. JD483]|uniref:FadR/GntR family transcriptional regulator n=1 Tax=unclassified Conexibacter TaxID=2627773 RepID=UPI00271C9803|nr:MULTISPECIES: GntR family transcriptional regulator [unclassified Conexibacter]MDO8187954.1 GntR family transcriptional regulator [Conexibacter sp. CPCC 205706]MDO8200177.1 GntR family transcriptional regulator [Conexibacter sp. CPCC 205762]MDR9369723.1 GntR family transcriptional regulator [Conexibacter sp. JD483]